MADLFDVLADSTRRDLLAALQKKSVGVDSERGELSVSELVGILQLSQPTVSKHLRVLRDNQLVSVREVGQHRLYSLDREPLAELQHWLIPFLDSTPSADADADGDGDGDGTAVADGLDRARNLANSDARSAVFANFAGDRVPATVRTAVARLQNAAVSGDAFGRTMASAVNGARTVGYSAVAVIRRRVVGPISRVRGRY